MAIEKLTDAEVQEIVDAASPGDPLETEHYEKDKSKDVPVGAKIDPASDEAEYNSIKLDATNSTIAFGVKIDKVNVDDKDKPIEDGTKFKQIEISRLRITPEGGEMVEIKKRTIKEVAGQITGKFEEQGLRADVVSGSTLPTRPTVYLKDINLTVEAGSEETLKEKRGMTFIEVNSEGEFDKVRAIADGIIEKVQTSFDDLPTGSTAVAYAATITHNLGRKPLVQVIDPTGLVSALVTVTHNNDNSFSLVGGDPTHTVVYF